MATRSRRPQPPAETATFIFQGTVRRARGTTMGATSSTGPTAIVHVDQVLEAPRDLVGWAGQDITVQLAPGARVTAGRALVFRTVPLMFGEGLLVKALAQEPVTPGRAAAAAAEDPSERHAARQLAEHVGTADLVVSGQVTAVTLPPDARPGAARAAQSGAASTTRPISEHDPKWRDATVEVDKVHKGEHTASTVTVRFPASNDVRWYKAPKFHPGQHGVFVLHRAASADVPAGPAARAAVRRREPVVYTALDATDFHPTSATTPVPAAPAASTAKKLRRRT